MTTTAHSDIHRIVDAHAAAVRSGDVDAMLADLAEDVVVFDVVDPLRHTGLASVRERAVAWVTSYEGPVTWENCELVVAGAGDVAFASMLSHVTGTLRNGTLVDMFFRKTLGFERRDGRWLITHDHGSVPFDPATGQASLSLQP